MGRTQRGSSGRPSTNLRIQLRCVDRGGSDSVSGVTGSSSVVIAATPRSGRACAAEGFPPQSLRSGCRSWVPLWATRTWDRLGPC